MVISVVKLQVHTIKSINCICLRNSWRHCIWAMQSPFWFLFTHVSRFMATETTSSPNHASCTTFKISLDPFLNLSVLFQTSITLEPTFTNSVFTPGHFMFLPFPVKLASQCVRFPVFPGDSQLQHDCGWRLGISWKSELPTSCFLD